VDFLPPVVAKLLADVGEFKAAFGEAQAETEGFQAAQNRMASAGKVAMGALAIGVAAIGYESVKMASSFDQAMELVHTQAGASQTEVDMLKQKVLDLAGTVGIGPEALAEGLYHVESAGFRGAQALDITAAAARDAAIGMGDMETTTQALIGVMASGIGGVKDAADAAAYLNQIVGIGDMRMDKLAASISTGILPSFKSAGLQMNDFGAALATITDNATPADEAATRLRMTVSLMSAPSHAAIKALASVGIGSTQLADDLRKPNGLLVAVMDLKTHLEKSGMTASQQNAVIQQAFGGGKTSGAILTLLEESDRLKDKYNELGTSSSRAGKFQDAWAAQQQQFTQQLHQLGAAAQSVGINIGNWIIPKLQAGATWLAKHQEAAKLAAVVIGGILVAAMVAWTASVIANTVAMLANPTTWIILAIIAAVALLAIGIYELVKHWGTVWAWIKRIALDVWHWLVDAWHATWGAIMAVVNWVKNKIIDPIVSFFQKYLVAPIVFYLSIILDIWKFVWGFLSVVFADWMAYMRFLWGLINTWLIQPAKRWLFEFYGWIDKVFAQPAVKIFHWLMDQIHAAWNRLLDVISTVKGWLIDFYSWLDRTIIQPILSLFDKISGAIGRVLGGIKNFADSASHMGGSFAHFLGFDQGGPVPGPPGAPMLAVVHGGEYVLSRDMISGMRSARLPTAGAAGVPVGQGTPQRMDVHNHIYLDGKEMHAAMIRPAQRYKRRNGTTGLGT
jgi:TP901 family phage tail tape measure protein